MNKDYYQPMECPVCGKFFFSELQEGDETEHLQCSKCGWLYDYDQAQDHDMKTGKNAKSVNEYRLQYQDKIATDPDYDYAEAHRPPKEPHLCPVCEKYTFSDRDSFDICPVCGWTDDGLMEDDPDRWAGSSNDLSLNDYRNRYLQK